MGKTLTDIRQLKPGSPNQVPVTNSAGNAVEWVDPTSGIVDSTIQENSTNPVQNQVIHQAFEDSFKRNGYYLNTSCRVVVDNSASIGTINFDSPIVIASYGLLTVRQVFVRDDIDALLTGSILKNEGNIFRLNGVQISNDDNLAHPSNKGFDVYFSDLDIEQFGVPANYTTYTMVGFTDLVDDNVSESYDVSFQVISPFKPTIVNRPEINLTLPTGMGGSITLEVIDNMCKVNCNNLSFNTPQTFVQFQDAFGVIPVGYRPKSIEVFYLQDVFSTNRFTIRIEPGGDVFFSFVYNTSVNSNNSPEGTFYYALA